jgi:CRP-like cAMP-binding protein
VSTLENEDALERLETRRRCAPGTVLFREGEQPNGVFVLHDGKVDLLFSSRTGHIKPLRTAEAGQIVGLSSVVGGRPYDCTATARTPTIVGFIDRDAFLRALDEMPSLWFTVLRFLSNDVNGVYDDMRVLAVR